MGSIVFLPGTLGSRLFLAGDEIWPPTPIEAKLGYHRIAELLDPAVVAGDPIDAVLCFKFYEPLLDDLKDIASGNAGAPRRAFHPFGYDWRLDLERLAADVAGRIDGLAAGELDEIHFVGHSMGCLIFRLILESGAFDSRPWFGAVRSFTSLAGPHQGAPTALVRAIGLEGAVGLSGPDIKRIAADPRYPSLYQLLPAPGTAAVVESRANRLSELDLYSGAVAERLGLGRANLNRAKAIHRVLSRNRRPGHVDYVTLAGSGHDTWLRVDLIGDQAKARKGKDSGDGTVPLWSAIDPTGIHHAAPAPHADVFRHEQIRTLLYAALGARPAAQAFMSGAQKPLLTILPTHTIYAAGRQVDLMLVPVLPARSIDGDLVVEFSDAGPTPAFQVFARHRLRYDGVAIGQLSVRLDPPQMAGFYRVGFEGSHDLADEGAVFGVSDIGGASGE